MLLCSVGPVPGSLLGSLVASSRESSTNLIHLCRAPLGVGMADLPLEGDADLHQLDGPLEIAALDEDPAEVPGGLRLVPPIADLAGDREGLLEELDRTPRLPQICVGKAQAGQRDALALPIVDLARPIADLA